MSVLRSCRVNSTALPQNLVATCSRTIALRPALRGGRSPRILRASPAGNFSDSSTLQSLHSIRLFGKPVKDKLVDIALLYFYEVWGSCNLDALDDFVDENVVYNDKTVFDEDFIGRKRLKKIIAEYLGAYPTLKFRVDKVVADDDCESVLVKWSAKGASLGPRMNVPATGRVSDISGITYMQFDQNQCVRQLITYRQPFNEERSLFE